MKSSNSAYSYDEVLYPGYPFPQTHPDRLGAMARLFGMNPAPVERCRVLELGCGDGGNLIPMAYGLRESEFVGVDLGARGIAVGQETVDALGLSNVKLRCLDLLQAGDLGRFDYILAHGVYSWVPPEVQERMLAICRESLNPQGVAYISYSVYPGAHLRNMVAEMLQYHVRRFATTGERMEQTGAMLAFLSNGPPAMREEAERLAKRAPASLFHDELCEVHSAVYFREFVESASRHQLQYLGEADFFQMLDSNGPLDLSATPAEDPIEKEQYLDFLKCRRFRQTLLCHDKVPLNRRIDSRQMQDFYVGPGRKRNKPPEQTPSDHPVAKALAALMEASPAVWGFDELRQRTGADDDQLLSDIVLGFFAGGLFQLHVHRPKFAAAAGKFPRASALARLQARTGPYVTNLCHGMVHLKDDPSVRLLSVLDGTRNRAALLKEFGHPPAEDLERGLQGLAKLALLEQ